MGPTSGVQIRVALQGCALRAKIVKISAVDQACVCVCVCVIDWHHRGCQNRLGSGLGLGLHLGLDLDKKIYGCFRINLGIRVAVNIVRHCVKTQNYTHEVYSFKILYMFAEVESAF